MSKVKSVLSVGMGFCIAVAFISLIFSPYGCKTYQSLTKERKKSVERGLLEKVHFKGERGRKMSLSQRMQYYKVPGVSIALLDKYKLEWVQGYGVMSTESTEPVSEESLFQAGQLSQAVTSLGVLFVLEKREESLDENVNHLLKSWKLPGVSSGEKVTPRGLLAHSAGLNPIQYEGYLKGKDLPSVHQILRGEKPSHSPPVRVQNPPGSEVRYTEGGFVVLQLMLQDLEGTDFPQLMKENVLNPLGMEQSTFEQPLPQKYRERTASGHLQNGQPVPGKWHNYPEMAASGLWTTASDLSLFAAAVMETAMGKREDLVSTETVRSMLTPQVGDRGLGFIIQDEGDKLNFHLEGENKGYVCYMVAYPARGQGAVIMTNSDNGSYLIDEILRGISEVYDWPHFETETKKLYRLKEGILNQYVGRYQMTPDYILTVTYEDYYLVVQAPGQGRTKFYVENRTTFFSRAPYTKIQFIRDPQGRVDRLAWKRGGEWREAEKID